MRSLLPSIAADIELPFVEQDLIHAQFLAASAPIRSLHALLPLSLHLLLKSSDYPAPTPVSLHSHLTTGTLCFVGATCWFVQAGSTLSPRPTAFPTPRTPSFAGWCVVRISRVGISFSTAGPVSGCCVPQTLVRPGTHFPSMAPPLLSASLRQRVVSGVTKTSALPCWLCASCASPAG